MIIKRIIAASTLALLSACAGPQVREEAGSTLAPPSPPQTPFAQPPLQIRILDLIESIQSTSEITDSLIERKFNTPPDTSRAPEIIKFTGDLPGNARYFIHLTSLNEIKTLTITTPQYRDQDGNPLPCINLNDMRDKLASSGFTEKIITGNHEEMRGWRLTNPSKKIFLTIPYPTPSPEEDEINTHCISSIIIQSTSPPILSSTAIWSPIPQPKEIGREEALYRRTDDRLPA